MLDQHKSGPADTGDRPVKERSQNRRERMKNDADEVVVTSDDSFPASDPPSWTSVGGIGAGRDRKPKPSE